jgi:hypothetical protein
MIALVATSGTCIVTYCVLTQLDVSHYPHQAVALVYFDYVARFARYVKNEPGITSLHLSQYTTLSKYNTLS